MQLLYLLPPALLLWQRVRRAAPTTWCVLVPVLVMAAGQLAGGLAWLAISGEDAPDLVATAPVPAALDRARQDRGGARAASPSSSRRSCSAMALASPRDAAGRGARHRAPRPSGDADPALVPHPGASASHFRRRQTSSRIATFAEAFSSITWAATAGLAAAGHWQAAITAMIALGILVGARAVSPHKP